ncbi:MAG TPA: exopolysaccharide biosynthesis polyprenyl glycosylphosphotransferase, partial [Bacteroidota bacterium]|nr:exopolysaccharide biosynthesis polyprenyl glycosylphosphotransferase [Bacteroidota bacterium]
MSRRNDALVPALGVAFDAVAIECAFLLSYFVRFHTNLLRFLPLNEEIPSLGAYVASSLLIIPVWLMLFQSGKMYGARRNPVLGDELFNIIKYITLGMLIVMSAAFFYRSFSYSRVVFVLLWISSVLTIFVDRTFLYAIEKSLYRQGKELRNAVIIGNNETAVKIYSTLYNHPALGYRFIGYFGDEGKTESGLPLKHLGGLDRVADLLQENDVELALIALNRREDEQLFQLVRECEGINVEFMIVPNIMELMTSQIQIKEIEGIPFIRIKGLPMSSWGMFLKRLFDLITAVALVIVTSPILLVIAILVKLDSKGPVFFLQPRIGMDGKEFKIIKYRSMKADAPQYDSSLDRRVNEYSSGAQSPEVAEIAKRGDMRVTRLGGFLRVTSLDELPQLFNVIRGEMSLVGPRPERPYYVEQFKQFIPKYLDRHRVKTGITGWAQVHGLRGDSSLEERIRYDIYY